MTGLSISIGLDIGTDNEPSDVLVQNNLEYIDGSNILFIDGSYMLQVE